MTTTLERLAATKVQMWAARHGMPVYAPVAMAEEIAADALRRGATLAEAAERAAGYLRSWYAHPSN